MAILHLSTKAEQDLPAAMTWEDLELDDFFLTSVYYIEKAFAMSILASKLSCCANNVSSGFDFWH